MFASSNHKGMMQYQNVGNTARLQLVSLDASHQYISKYMFLRTVTQSRKITPKLTCAPLKLSVFRTIQIK